MGFVPHPTSATHLQHFGDLALRQPCVTTQALCGDTAQRRIAPALTKLFTINIRLFGEDVEYGRGRDRFSHSSRGNIFGPIVRRNILLIELIYRRPM